MIHRPKNRIDIFRSKIKEQADISSIRKGRKISKKRQKSEIKNNRKTSSFHGPKVVNSQLLKYFLN